MLDKFKLDKLKGTQKMVALMNCFRGDLPQVHGIVGKTFFQAPEASCPHKSHEETIRMVVALADVIAPRDHEFRVVARRCDLGQRGTSNACSRAR
jgi:hypothetical protein